LAEGTVFDAAARQTVALVVPLFNEEEVFPILFEELERYRVDHPDVVQVIFVDDGSRDGTAALVRALTSGKAGYTLIRFSRNFGHQLAITAGMYFVDADAAVIIDADLQDPLDAVTRMIERWREGYDVVYGIRKQRQGETFFKKTTASIFYRFFRWMTDLDIPLDTGDFRLVSRRVLDAYRSIQEQQPFVRGLITWLGFNQTGIEYERAPRAAGSTKYPFRKMFRLATASLTSFSDKPLKLAARLGLLTAGVAFAGLVWVLLVKYVFEAAITGWASLIFVAFFFGGLQLFFLGMVGLYLDRVYEEVKGRPRYLVQERWSSDAPPAARTDAPGSAPHPFR
jgi:polyisoprenyl-phosphate glycosyltransferase